MSGFNERQRPKATGAARARGQSRVYKAVVSVENGRYAAYCAELNLTGYGDSGTDAMNDLADVMSRHLGGQVRVSGKAAGATPSPQRASAAPPSDGRRLQVQKIEATAAHEQRTGQEVGTAHKSLPRFLTDARIRFDTDLAMQVDTAEDMAVMFALQRSLARLTSVVSRLLGDDDFWNVLQSAEATTASFTQEHRLELFWRMDVPYLLEQVGYVTPPPPSAGDLVIGLQQALIDAHESQSAVRQAWRALYGFHARIRRLQGERPTRPETKIGWADRVRRLVAIFQEAAPAVIASAAAAVATTGDPAQGAVKGAEEVVAFAGTALLRKSLARHGIGDGADGAVFDAHADAAESLDAMIATLRRDHLDDAATRAKRRLPSVRSALHAAEEAALSSGWQPAELEPYLQNLNEAGQLVGDAECALSDLSTSVPSNDDEARATAMASLAASLEKLKTLPGPVRAQLRGGGGYLPNQPRHLS